MLSKNEYNLLIQLRDNRHAIDNDIISIRTFREDKLIVSYKVGYNDYQGFRLTPLGERAIEEYENFQKSAQMESESVLIARESNEIAKSANKIANHANKISKKANWLSSLAIIFSFIAAIAAVVSACATVKSCSRKTAQHFVNFDNHHLLVIFVTDSNPVLVLSKIKVPIKIF